MLNIELSLKLATKTLSHCDRSAQINFPGEVSVNKQNYVYLKGIMDLYI